MGFILALVPDAVSSSRWTLLCLSEFPLFTAEHEGWWIYPHITLWKAEKCQLLICKRVIIKCWENKWLAQGHLGSMWQSWKLNADLQSCRSRPRTQHLSALVAQWRSGSHHIIRPSVGMCVSVLHLACSLSVGRIGYISKNQLNMKDQAKRKATQNLPEKLWKAFSTSYIRPICPYSLLLLGILLVQGKSWHQYHV